MAKKASKRREWTKDDVRELKTMAKSKYSGTEDRQETQTKSRGNTAKSVQHEGFTGLSLRASTPRAELLKISPKKVTHCK
jgi:hypothetical protein